MTNGHRAWALALAAIGAVIALLATLLVRTLDRIDARVDAIRDLTVHNSEAIARNQTAIDGIHRQLENKP